MGRLLSSFSTPLQVLSAHCARSTVGGAGQPRGSLGPSFGTTFWGSLAKAAHRREANFLSLFPWPGLTSHNYIFLLKDSLILFAFSIVLTYGFLLKVTPNPTLKQAGVKFVCLFFLGHLTSLGLSFPPVKGHMDQVASMPVRPVTQTKLTAPPGTGRRGFRAPHLPT